MIKTSRVEIVKVNVVATDRWVMFEVGHMLADPAYVIIRPIQIAVVNQIRKVNYDDNATN